MEEYVVYILKSQKNESSYVGMTSNLISRFLSHNKLSKKGFTVKHRPWSVVYIEFFSDKSEALKREKYFKSGSGLYKKKEILEAVVGSSDSYPS
jgi:putative endonuclease